MPYCPECQLKIRGHYEKCPLCGSPCQQVRSEGGQADEELGTSLFPLVPLVYHKKILYKLLSFLSLVLALAYLGLKGFYPQVPVTLVHLLALVASLWLLVSVIIRRRRNIAKSLLYLLASLSGLALVWDYLTGWRAWSISYAIPALIFSAILAILIAVGYIQQNLHDYILSLAAVLVIGFVPLVLISFKLLTAVWPSILVLILASLTALFLLTSRWSLLVFELKKRLRL